jgi:hypothetical protein
VGDPLARKSRLRVTRLRQGKPRPSVGPCSRAALSSFGFATLHPNLGIQHQSLNAWRISLISLRTSHLTDQLLSFEDDTRNIARLAQQSLSPREGNDRHPWEHSHVYQIALVTKCCTCAHSPFLAPTLAASSRYQLFDIRNARRAARCVQ